MNVLLIRISQFPLQGAEEGALPLHPSTAITFHQLFYIA
jgi:hypothetical protein